MLKVWGRQSSLNVQKVMWLVDELGVECEHTELGGSFGGLDEPSFRAKNPHGKVPVIEDGDTVVWESHAILRYLADAHGNETLYPREPAARAGVEQWIEWTQTMLLHDFLQGVFWGFYRTPEPDRNVPAVERSIRRCGRHVQVLDALLEGRQFLLGDSLTLADVPAGTCLYRYFNIEIERPKVPNVEAWYARLQERTPYQAQIMVPFGELYGRLAY
tara:strand:+ start:407 stop:1054 length:648 start_codon:yes stop_codon:yes gene_type:complete